MNNPCHNGNPSNQYFDLISKLGNAQINYPVASPGIEFKVKTAFTNGYSSGYVNSMWHLSTGNNFEIEIKCAKYAITAQPFSASESKV